MKKRHLIALLLGILPTSVAFADNVTYTIDSGRSTLSISGTFDGQPIEFEVERSVPDNQIIAHGSTASYFGTITADHDEIANTLQITGATITAQDDVSWNPLPEPASYGISATTNGGLLQPTTLLAAIRNFSFSLTSPSLTLPNGIDVSQLLVAITSGQVDYSLMEFFHPIPTEVDGSSSFPANFSLASESGNLADSNGVETLTTPINTDFLININGSPLELQLSGEIVATTTVPEPVSLSLFIPGILLFRRTRP